MQFSTLVTLAVSLIPAALASESFHLQVQSTNAEANGKYLEPRHEGAGISYLFLSDDSSNSPLLETQPGYIFGVNEGEYVQYFDAAEGDFVSLTVQGKPSNTYSTSVERLPGDSEGLYMYVNSERSGFYACKNGGDPYDYASSQYALMYYGSDSAPDGCIEVTLAVIDHTYN